MSKIRLFYHKLKVLTYGYSNFNLANRNFNSVTENSVIDAETLIDAENYKNAF